MTETVFIGISDLELVKPVSEWHSFYWFAHLELVNGQRIKYSSLFVRVPVLVPWLYNFIFRFVTVIYCVTDKTGCITDFFRLKKIYLMLSIKCYLYIKTSIKKLAFASSLFCLFLTSCFAFNFFFLFRLRFWVFYILAFCFCLKEQNNNNYILVVV